jgi:hypothetical protein
MDIQAVTKNAGSSTWAGLDVMEGICLSYLQP